MNFLETERLKPPVTRTGIYWLASYPKSGNTWTRAFIGHLLGTIGNDPDVENTNAMLAKYTVVECWRPNYSGLLNEQSDLTSILRARPHAQQLLATKFARSGFVKTHSVALSAQGVNQINLGVTRGAVYIVRNPLDVAVSYASHFGVSIDEAIRRMNLPAMCMATDGDQLAEVVSTWSAHVLSWLESPMKPFILRYEDMIDRPLDAFSAFLRHAAVSATPEQIQRALDLSNFPRLQEQESTIGFDKRLSERGRQFFRVGKSGQWRDGLSPAQIDRIVKDHGKMMERFGYLPE
jgi:hypothetical protein